jgi:hypothetical protein
VIQKPISDAGDLGVRVESTMHHADGLGVHITSGEVLGAPFVLQGYEAS